MEDLRSTTKDHVDLVSESFEKFADDFRNGLRPGNDYFIGFFHAIDWKEPFLICLVLFHATLFLGAVFSRKNVNMQFFVSIIAYSGIYLAERLNTFLAGKWKYFAGQNYFDSHGLFISMLWSIPLHFVTVFIMVNALVMAFKYIIPWKKAEQQRRDRIARGKED